MSKAQRDAAIKRTTKETEISLSLTLEGKGEGRIATGIGFFDHMLALLCRHAIFDMTIDAKGDREVDDHHTVEDVGICLGQALAQALGDKRGIARYGSICLPMDEALAQVAIDLSGRPCLVWRADLPAGKVGDFDICLAAEFFRALCNHAGMCLHVLLLAGTDPHHSLEAIFKAVGRALRDAVSRDAREPGVPSTKGVL
ncbi:MAG: imidazoleglycerol-phosphate dehydratase HisB [Planctomycetota bacterium]|nr:imidazoleglycerol-phosphate dehydratase HisB [Planctomycetota bacterium]